jgi:ribosomal protein L16 Arg81 hydroxylase
MHPPLRALETDDEEMDRAASPPDGLDVDAGFDSLVAPIPRATFLREHWEARSLFLHREARVPRLPGVEFGTFEFKAAAALLPPGSLKAQYRDQEDRTRQLEITAPQIEPMLENGMTVMMMEVQRVHPGLARLVDLLRADLGFCGHLSCNAFLSPRSSGYGIHFDQQSLFNIQLEGSKRWRYGRRPALRFPPSDLVAQPFRLRVFRDSFPWADFADPDPDEMETCEMQPGDALYLPGGTWHTALAGERSLALTVGFRNNPVHRTVIAELESALAAHERWRLTPAPLAAPASRLDDLPAEARAHLRACAAELRTLVAEQLTEQRLAELCYGLPPDGADNQPEPELARAEAPAAAAEPPGLAPSRALRMTVPLVVDTHVDPLSGESSLRLTSGEKTIALPIGALLFARRLTELRSFSAESLWAAPDIARVYSLEELTAGLADLLAWGFLEPAV